MKVIVFFMIAPDWNTITEQMERDRETERQKKKERDKKPGTNNQERGIE